MPNLKILFIGLYLIGGNFVDIYNTLTTCLKEWSQLECDAVWADAINKAAFITDKSYFVFHHSFINITSMMPGAIITKLEINEVLVYCKIELK